MTEPLARWHSEAELVTSREAIDANWARAESLSFDGVAGVRINALCVPAVSGSATAPAVVMLPGRTEALIKYRELALDLNRRGHALYLLDHRGQGQSGRLLDDPERGHVVDFEHYVDDAEAFVETQVIPREGAPIALFAHSMGGCIATRLLQRRPALFGAAVLFAPMLEIQTGALPVALASVVIATLAALPVGGGREAYVPGGRGFVNTPFEQDGVLNPLTHSRARFEQLMADYQQVPETQLGSPTRAWFQQAQRAMRAAIRDAAQIQTPTLLFNAQDDPIVGFGGQQALCSASPAVVGPRVIEGARHELLMETDAIRSRVLDDAVAFIDDSIAR